MPDPIDIKLALVAAGLSLALLGCKKDEPGEPAKSEPAKSERPAKTEPAKKTASVRAVVLKDHTLSALAADGSLRELARLEQAAHCETDRHHGVIWLLGTSLWAFEPDSGRIIEVGKGTSPSDTWGVVVEDVGPYPTKTAGDFSEQSDCAALVLSTAPKPTFGGMFVGEFVHPPCDEAKFKKAIDAYGERVSLVNADYVANLRTRKSETPKPPPPPARPSITVKDRPACKGAAPPCGSSKHAGGTVWRVSTGDTMGHFKHNHYQLYDTSAQAFWDVRTGKTSVAPFDEDGDLVYDHEGDDFKVAPDGSWAIFENKRVSLSPAKVEGSFEGTFCGWTWAPN